MGPLLQFTVPVKEKGLMEIRTPEIGSSLGGH